MTANLCFKEPSRRSGRRRRPRLAVAFRSFEECPKLRRRLELRDRIEFLEGRGEGVREAPHRARLKLLELRVEVEVVDFARQVFRGVQFLFDERSIYKELGVGFRELEVLPGLDLAAHGLEIALHPVYAHGQG